MKALITLILIIGTNGHDWKTINNLKKIFEYYSELVENTVSRIGDIIQAEKNEGAIFIEKIYEKYPILLEFGDNNVCAKQLLNHGNLNSSFMVQVFQLEFPLNERILDFKERLSSINSTLEIYQDLADSKYKNCLVFNNSCEQEINEWLDTMMQSLSCSIIPNCNEHSIRKRSTCSSDQFRCSRGSCIDSYKYCDGSCNCYDGGCSDEPLGCVRNCYGFRCKTSFKCISKSSKCDGEDDCGDGSDEEDCPPPVYTHANCSFDAGSFLCGTKKCIAIELVCDGHDDCEDGTDEGEQCNEKVCPPSCRETGGVCLRGTCLSECPPGMFETSKGCSPEPEPSPATLSEVIMDTPRLTARYMTRLKYLKMKILKELSKSMQEIVRCNKGEYALLSKIIKFSSRSVHTKGTSFDNSKTQSRETSTSADTSFETSSPTPVKTKIDYYEY